MPLAEYRQAVAHGVVAQWPRLGLDPCGDQGRVERRRQQVGPAATLRSRQVIEDELYGDRLGHRAGVQVTAVAQLQPGRPVGEGAAVAAQGIGRRAGRDERRSGGLGAGLQPIGSQRGYFRYRERYRFIHYVQRIIISFI
ncbi:hypothetical protein D9M70_532140 [compost metagenome]